MYPMFFLQNLQYDLLNELLRNTDKRTLRSKINETCTQKVLVIPQADIRIYLFRVSSLHHTFVILTSFATDYHPLNRTITRG